MPAYGNTDIAFPGLELGYIDDMDIDTGIVQEPNGIPFGAAVFALKGQSNQMWGGHLDQVSSLLSAALSASNVWSLQVSFTTSGPTGSLVGGTVLTTAALQVTFASTAAATMTAMIAAFAADPAVIAAGASMTSADTTHFVIKITPTSAIPMSDINLATCSVAGGSAVTFTNTYSTQMVLVGVAHFEQKAMRLTGGGNQNFEQYSSVNAMRRGRLWVSCANAITDKALGYYILGGTNKGLWTDTATPSGGTIYLPQSPQGASTSTPSGIQPMFRSATQTINSQVIAQMDVRGIY